MLFAEGNMGIGALITRARKSARKSQEALARELDRSRETVRNWEDDDRPEQPRYDDILRIAEITGKLPTFFFPKKQQRRGAVSAAKGPK